jgi:hypothetical protein
VCSKTQWCTGEPPATETLAMSLTWGCPWLVSLGVLVLAFNIYTYVIFLFIEVGESMSLHTSSFALRYFLM